MTSWPRALLLVGIAVALALVSLWSGDEPPAPAHVAQPVEVATETAPAVAAGASAPAGRDDEADGARVAASTPAHVSRSLTVTVQGEVPTTPDGLQVALLFGERYESELRLRVGRKGTATWTSGDGVAWPAAVDFAFPSRGDSFVSVGEAPRAVLTAPPTCVLNLEVVEADGLPSTEPMTASVRVPGARPPADRTHELAVVDGRAVILAEATGALMEVEVRTSSGRSVQRSFSAARENGEEVECKVALPGQHGLPLRVTDLPPGDEPWRVDLYASAETGPVRAPRAGAGHLAFLEGQRIGNDALVIATRGAERRWGRVRGGVAATAAEVEVAQGRVVDAEGSGVEGVRVGLFRSLGAKALGGRLHEVRTDADGSFRLTGPSPDDVSLALRVEATAEVIALPQRQPLLLRATR